MSKLVFDYGDGTRVLAEDPESFRQHVIQGATPYFENGQRAYWYAAGNGSNIFILDVPPNTPGARGINWFDFFGPTPPPTVTPLAPFLGSPIPGNAGATIGPVVWQTVQLADAIVAGPVTLTNGVDTVTENSIVGITQRLENGFQVLRPNGQPAFTQTFLGGYLVDGNPLNVLLGEPWLPEQWAAIVPAIQAGEVPSPSILPLGEQPVALDEGLAKFALPVTGIAAAAVLWSWLRRRKGN